MSARFDARVYWQERATQPADRQDIMAGGLLTLAFQNLSYLPSPDCPSNQCTPRLTPFAFRLSFSLTLGVFCPNGSGTSDAPDPLCR